MLKQTHLEFKKFFIVEFTKEIIRSTETYQKLIISKEVKKVISEDSEIKRETNQREEAKKKIKKLVRERIQNESERLANMKKWESLPEFDSSIVMQRNKSVKRQIPELIIPEPNLPWTVKDIRPFPSMNQEELRLGKIDALIKDPLVKTIECNGPNEKVIVTGAMGRKRTGITLEDEEIDYIIQRFSSATKIPVSEGIFRVVFGKLSLSAVVSEVVDSKFIIKKMPLPPLQIPFPR
ncbi:MAG: hypothetical protein KJ905_03910 [Nanoarchaeota archaeon]|nr:hypothetical protein [Nanoarchaeota archaeon]MBU1501886.1 hypothetical protein [Nanoarchaeota archaeon]MBU2459374.1 hypothetical protein [Nanoarchaeota archaeon]